MAPYSIGNLQIDFMKRLLLVQRINDFVGQHHTLSLNIGCAIDGVVQIREHTVKDNLLVMKTDDEVELSIKYDNADELYEKYEITWKSTEKYQYMKDVVRTDSGAAWYGGPQIAQQKWPIARNSYDFSPYLPLDTLKDGAKTPSGMERYWLCSNKFAIFVPDETPLWTEHSDGRLSLQAQISDSPYVGFYTRIVGPTLCYSIYAAKCCTLREFHNAVHECLYELCTTVPDEALIRKPIWSTWVRYTAKINQQEVLDFAKEIKNNEAPICQLELDDCWASHYGDFEFDKSKFPDVEGMCKQLKEWNIRLTLWVHPFISLDSNNGKNPALKHLLVKDCTGEPGVINWWQGRAYVIDFTNPEAAQWYREQLESMKKLGIFSFKFDAGEVTYLPTNVRLHAAKYPNDFSEAYVRMAASFGSAVEARVFRRTQPLPIFYRTMDRFSTWSNVGLDTLLPVALNFGLHGYYYNLPDMIGGNGYSGEMCSKELYIRWMQANQFLLSMQFSYSPWQYDDEVCDVFHRIMKKREELMDFLVDACRKSCADAEPVIRPLWWLSESQEALLCGDQFVISDSMIVAPVFVEGATSRTVFLPDGIWKYELTQQKYTGPCNVTVEAPLLHHAPPYFNRVS